MSGLRFSIANLLAVTALVGVGLAALKADSGVVAGLLTLATVGALGVAVLGCIYARPDARAFWVGFFVFGMAFFVVAMSPAFPAAKAEINAPLMIFYSRYWAATIPSWNNAFGATIYCIVNLLFGLLGGITGRCFYALSK